MKADSFGRNLEKILDILNIKQRELAKRSGLTEAAISMIICGKRMPSLRSLIKIAEALPLGISIDVDPNRELAIVLELIYADK